VPDPKTDSLGVNDAPRSPFAGCLILIVIGVVICILVGTTAYTLKKQTDAYQTFTEQEARPTKIEDPSRFPAPFNSLANRLRHFDHEVKNGRAAEIELTPLDLNLAIARFDELKSFRGQLYFESISDSELNGTLHFPFNSNKNLPDFVRSILGIEARDNNLNGTFTGTPLLTDGKLILNLEKITPPKGEVPEEVLLSIARILISGELEKAVEDDPKNPPELLKTLRKLTSLSLREGKLVLAYQPDKSPPSVKEESDAMATKAKQLIALGAVIFILTMILFFVLMSRRQKAKREALREEKREKI
jgi:hypothetical protein